MLWFDVGIVRYTTQKFFYQLIIKLWFDVGIVRYTTTDLQTDHLYSCGLM